jgi:NAD(P)-dependent dehydrogenase (short-subunit alcohol dehydrogenase family)
MTRLKGKVALVTGAQQGIGEAAAVALGAEGAHVVVNWLDDADAAKRIVQTIAQSGSQASLVQGDVSESTAIERLLTETQQLGGIDVLVNNAGIFPRVPFLDMAPGDWDRVMDVNLRGAFLLSQGAARQMVEHGRGGSIVNLTSVAALRSSPRGVHYVASKAGIIGLTRASALELSGHNIRVNAIAPGLTDTAQPRDGMTEEEIDAVAAEIPLGGITGPEDIAEGIVFLASDAAKRITGQTLSINGGQFLY